MKTLKIQTGGRTAKDKIDKLVEKIISEWSTSDRKESVEVAVMLLDVLKNKRSNVEEPSSELNSSSPDLEKIADKPENKGIGDIVSLLR